MSPFDHLAAAGAHDERKAFADGARRLAGLVPRALGWRPDEFWNATPAELAAILTDPAEPGGEPLSRVEMSALMERDHHG